MLSSLGDGLVTQKRGWVWLFSGALLALIAGLLTFRTINEATTNATLSQLEEMPTLQVLVAAQDIAARQIIDESMFKTQKIPATLVPAGYVKEAAEIVGKMSETPLVAGEILLSPRLFDPTDPNSPVLYKIKPNEVLVAVPANAILGQTGMLAIGDRIDLAYTVAIDFDTEVTEAEKQEDIQPATTFLSLQNLEVKGLLRRQPSTEETTALMRPDAILLAVPPQDALVIKHLVDTGAPMDFLLRAPGNDALSPVLPVDAQYLIDRFQLPATPSKLADDENPLPSANTSVNVTASNILSNTTNDGGGETVNLP